MTKVQKVEQEIERLSPQELAAFRDWFCKYDSDEWDQQIEADVRSGSLEAIANRAILEHKKGRSKEL